MTDLLDTDRIDLARVEEGDLVDLVSTPGATAPFGLYAFRSDEPGAELARRVERQVFLEAFGNTPELLAAEYGPYEDASVFVAVIDHRRRLTAGMARLILPSGAGLKSLDDLERMWGRPWTEVLATTPGFPGMPTWDMATLAVHPDYRGKAASGLVSMSLFQAIHTMANLCGVASYVSVLDSVVLRFLQWQLLKPCTTFPGIEARPYLGSSSSQAVWCDVAEWRERVRQADPTLFELVFEGRGQEPVVAPLEWAVTAERLGADLALRTS